MRLVPLESLSPSDLGEWRRLADRASEPNVFFEPDFVITASRSPNIEPPRLLVAEREQRWIGCLPVRPVGPFALTSWRHAYSYVGTPLVEEGRLEEFATTLVDHLLEGRRHRLLLFSKAIDAEVMGAIRGAVARAPRFKVHLERKSERAALRRRADGADLVIRPKLRKEAARNRRRLSQELGSDPEVVDRSTEPEAVEDFLALEAKGWKGADGTAMQTVGDGDMFRDVCKQAAAAGKLQMLALEGGGRPLAMQFNLSSGGTLFTLKVAFDEEFRRFAPGVQLEVAAMRIFQEGRHEQTLDSCTSPDNELLNRLWPDRLPIATMLIGPDGVLGRAAALAIDRVRPRRPPANAA